MGESALKLPLRRLLRIDIFPRDRVIWICALATFGELAMQERDTSNAHDLFSPGELGPVVLRNRVVMAPLTRSRAGPGNVPTQLNALYYAQRASAGLIISEASQISPEGQGYISTPGIHSAEQIEG